MHARSAFDSWMAHAARWHAALSTRRFLRAAEDAPATQQRLLGRILKAAASSDFGRRHAFDRIRSSRDFAERVPICAYSDLAPYMDRVRRGETQALLPPNERVRMFALTSGTTAEPKYIPITSRALADCRAGWNVWGLRALLDHPDCILRPIVQVTSPMNDHRAPSGVPCGAITGLLAATQKRLVRRYYASPLAVADISDALAKYYTIMRLSVPRDVAWLVTANPATLLNLARTADEQRQALIRDIHDGTLRADLPIEPAVRGALRPQLAPDPGCARRLEGLVREHGALLPKHYWRLGFLAHWTGGTMGLYRSQFPRWFGDVPARDIGLIASEGRMSIPFDDHTPSGALAIASQFFEFIPAEDYGASCPDVLLAGELAEGEEYFLLLTNHSGLYRYDIGDRVRVTGRLGRAPMIEFLSRGAHTSSLAGEKLTEDQVVAAMQRAGGDAVDGLARFVLAPRWADVPSYRLDVEAATDRSMPHLADRLDQALCDINLEYASKRKTRRLAAVEVAVLPDGALAERDRALRAQRCRASEQFKHQYLQPRPGLDEDLYRGRRPAPVGAISGSGSGRCGNSG